MNKETAARLIAVNAQFYQKFAPDFDATRQRIQPGVRRVLDGLDPKLRILDLGCGNGSVWRELHAQGHQGEYVGLDFSAELLTAAPEGLGNGRFIQADLTVAYWASIVVGGFDVVFAFAAMHHIPSRALHISILQQVHGLLHPGGRFVHSNWQFLNSEQWRKRVQDWDVIGLTPEAVDPGDYLLDWRRGGVGYRYVHHFSEEELAELAAETGFEMGEVFWSDGKEGNLAIYQEWKKAQDKGNNG